MFRNFEIIDLPLSVKANRKKVESFLSENDLDIADLDYYAGIFEGDEMLAGGGLEENVMKCIAVSPEAREYNLTNKLVSHLRSIGQKRGYDNIFVFTKPQNEEIFKSLAFNVIGRSTKAILLESNPYAISDYCQKLVGNRKDGISGCIVMNCNPMTLGHRYLIEEASKRVDTLHIILVEEDKSEFSFRDRLQMVKDGTSDLNNVMVHGGGKYVISSATFPNYFIKDPNDQCKAQIELDLDIFTSYIAPSLGINIRFTGSEAGDMLTFWYNMTMRFTLPTGAISFQEINRLQNHGITISASSVRKYIKEFKLNKALELVPEATKPFVISKCAEQLAKTAIDALYEELATTPKPGLVDKEDNGAHSDMDYNLMSKSIESLYPYFVQLAEVGMKYYDSPQKEILEYVRNIGIEAEEQMLTVTNGVNTHRGAIFSMGLCITAVAMIVASQKELTAAEISKTIAFIVKDFPRQQNSNGGNVCQKYNIKGALDCAKAGYSEIFSKVLPLYQELTGKETDNNTINIKTLLYIITLLDDTNVYHRKGAEVSKTIREKAQTILQDYNEQKVCELNKIFIRDNISPGGCADMLALVLFTNKVMTQKQTVVLH